MTFPYFTGRQVFRSALLFLFLLAVLTASSGKSVKMIMSWFNPNYGGQTFHKILVIGVAQNLEVRADFEDEMAAQIARPGIETIPGNHILLRPDPARNLTSITYVARSATITLTLLLSRVS